MLWFILTVGYALMALCLAILAVPKILRAILDFFSIGSRLYLAGFLRLAVGVVLLILATQTRFWGYVVTIGLISAASGMSVFFFALRRTKKLLLRFKKQSNLTLRLYAIAGLIIWAVLVYSLSPADSGPALH